MGGRLSSQSYRLDFGEERMGTGKRGGGGKKEGKDIQIMMI